MNRDYLIVHVNVWNETDFVNYVEMAKKYDDENLKTLLFPEGIVAHIDLLRPSSEEEDERYNKRIFIMDIVERNNNNGFLYS